MQNISQLYNLSEECKTCTGCDLHKNNSKEIRLGAGASSANIVYIDSGITTTEEYELNLKKILFKVKLDSKKLFRTSVCLCPNNDPLTKDQIHACRDYTLRCLRIINPKVVVISGDDALVSLFGDELDNYKKYYNNNYFGPVESPICEIYKIESLSKWINDPTSVDPNRILNHWQNISDNI